VASPSKSKLIGSVCSDSGSISVLDPCHLNTTKAGEVTLPRCSLYTSFDTEIGDGEFQVYEMRDSKGKLKCIVINLE